MTTTRLSTGIDGLDEILFGGLLANRSYLVTGGPGTGKTTLGLHFLITGIQNNEKVLYITMGESPEQIQSNAQSIGIDPKNIEFLDLSPGPEFFSRVESYDIFSPAEVEQESLTKKIVEHIETLRPQRVFLDAITQLRYLSRDNFQYHRQALSFLRFLTRQNATVVFTSEGGKTNPDEDLQFLSDGVIHLEYSPHGRNVNITKFRGSNFRKGYHSMRLSKRGMKVFPRLLPSSFKNKCAYEKISSGIPDLDELLNGGLERGTVTIITGPSGVGKTTTGLQFMKEAAARGERSVVYTFEEVLETLVKRSESISIPLQSMIDQGNLSITPVEPLYYSPDEFASLVRDEVENNNAKIVMLDSISGYRLSFNDKDISAHLHALCKYLKNMGVTVILLNEMESITGNFQATEIGISYLGDNILFLRYLEIHGEIHKAIGILKKRLGNFEKRLREFEITRYGIKIGKPLTNLKGILEGTPEWIE